MYNYDNKEAMCYRHVHDHTGITSCSHEHCHIYPGVTGPPIYDGKSHYHEITGATTFEDGHFHTYRAMTGPAIPLTRDYHTHQVCFNTSYCDGHNHLIKGFVQLAPSDAPPHYKG